MCSELKKYQKNHIKSTFLCVKDNLYLSLFEIYFSILIKFFFYINVRYTVLMNRRLKNVDIQEK